MNDLSPVFPMSTPPVNPGAYLIHMHDRLPSNKDLYSYFDGGIWGLTGETIEEAIRWAHVQSVVCYDSNVSGWQGLARKSK